MERHLIVLPDGTEIFSGLNVDHAIQSISHTSCSNRGAQLTIGSVCSDMLEVNLFTPAKNLNIRVGTEVEYFAVADDNTRKKIGIFRLETPTRPSRNTYKFVAYDHVSLLDRDVTTWLKELNGWPYNLLTFAQMVCDACMLTLVNTSLPNGDFPINKFYVSKCTARELMSWIGEISGRFCRATPDGNIEFAWYQDNGLMLEPTGENFYSSGLKYEDYQVEPVYAVQVQMADSDYGLLFPEVSDSENRYVITGNPLVSFVNSDLLPYLDVIRNEISDAVYSPCTVKLPARSDIRAGDIIRIKDVDGYIIQTYVMTRMQRGNKMTLESVGSQRRESPTSLNNREKFDFIVDAATKRLTQTTIFNKLTDNGTVEGFFLGEDGQIYINATYLSTGILQSKDGKTFYLDLDEGILKMDARELTIAGQSIGKAALENMSQEELVKALTNNGVSEGIYLIDNQLYINASYIVSGNLNASLITAGILQSKDEGETFKLDLENGTFHMSGTGKFMAPDKKSYITVEGGQFVLYAKKGEYGGFIDIARIGFSEDSEGVDYPYFILGNADAAGEDHGKIGLLKQFSNGIWLGNSAPRESVGNFIGLPGAAGLFVNTTEPRTYIVDGEIMADAFECVFA